MKKLISLLLALVMILSLSTVAFATTAEPDEEPSYNDMGSVTITKVYEATNAGTTSPAETFNFTIEKTGVSDAANGVTVENMPAVTVNSVTYAAGDAGSTETKAKQITLTLPEYTSVGIYTYTIKETAGTTAGVEYYGDDILLKVTVIEQNGKIRVAAVHTEDGFNGTVGNGKTDTITNTYNAGSLSVKKNVTGNLGDTTKEFKVTVTFTAPEGKTVKEDISYTDDTAKTISAGELGWTGEKTVEINLKHNETVTFTNIPYGVTYTVAEDDYTSDANGKYDKAQYTFPDSEKKIDTETELVVIENHKQGTVDTGVMLDSLPYMLILAVVAVTGTALIFKKRTNI